MENTPSLAKLLKALTTMEKIAKLETDKKEWPLKEVFIKAARFKIEYCKKNV